MAAQTIRRAALAVCGGSALALVAGALVGAPLATADDLTTLQALSGGFAELAEQVNPAVVQVFVARYQITSVSASADGLIHRERSSGSGVVVDGELTRKRIQRAVEITRGEKRGRELEMETRTLRVELDRLP